MLHGCYNRFFLHDLASFRAGIPTHRQLRLLNKNALVSLYDDHITEEKVRVNILANPHTLFLTPTNSTVEKINEYVINTLFGNQNVMRYVINGLHVPMPIYKNMTAIITENRYFPFLHHTFLPDASHNMKPYYQFFIA